MDFYNYQETSEEIHERMKKVISSETNTTVGSFQSDVTKPGADEFVSHNAQMWGISKMKDIEFLEGTELERYISQSTGLERKEATVASTDITFYGNRGKIISVGDLVSSSTMIYEVVEEISIDASGVGKAKVIAKQIGKVGNCKAGDITQMPRTLTGITSLTNEEEVTNGYDAEDDQTYINRYFEKLRNPGQSGNEAHYREWANEIEDVGDAIIDKCWNGPLTVKVILIDRNGLPSQEKTVAAVRDYILADKIPIGAELTVEAATSESIDVAADLQLQNNYEIEDITKKINIVFVDYFRDIAFQKDVISYAKIGCMILNTVGVKDYSNLKVNGESTNIEIDKHAVPIVGSLSFVEV